MRNTLFALALSVTALLASPASAGDVRGLIAEDLWNIKRPGAPEVAPDRRQAVVPVTRYNIEDNDGTTDLVLINLLSGEMRQLTHHESADSSPAWHPDSQRIAFVSRRDSDTAQLFVMSIGGGEPDRVTDLPVAVHSPKWFPDGQHIAFIANVPAGFDGDWDGLKQTLDARGKDGVSARVTEDRIYRFWDRWLTDDDVPRLFRVDVASGEITDLMPGHDRRHAAMDTPDYDIAPDGTEIAISVNTSAPPYEHMNLDVLLLRADGSGVARNITEDNPAHDSNPVYSRDGRHIFYGRQTRTDFYADTVRIIRYDRSSGMHTVLTGDVDLSFSNWRPDERGTRLFAQAQDRGATSIFSISVPDGRVSEVHRGGLVANMRLLPNNALLFVRSSLDNPPEVYSVTRHGRNLTRLTSFNDGVIRDVRMGRVENVIYKGANGADIQMWVVYPPDFDPGRKWPLLVQIHGGPHGIFGDEFHFRWNAQVFAAPGYVVALPNFHGSSSFGQAFTESIHGNHAELPYRDVMNAVDFMLERGYIDENRLAAAGGSYGGYLVSWIAGQTDRFAALINHAGVYNIMGQFASDITYHREASYGTPPWEDLEHMNRFNPAVYAENFSTPMLVIHGERDYRVPVTQGLEIYGIYKGMGLPARLVYYPDENHWILKPQNSIHWYGEFHAWLERWLGHGPAN